MTTTPIAEQILESKAELILSKQWMDCTDQQRIFVSEFISNGEKAFEATKVAYPDAKPESQKVMQYQILRSSAVAAALELWTWLGRGAQTQMITLMSVQLKAAEPGSVAAEKFTAQLERLTIGAPKPGRRAADDETMPNSKTEPQVPEGATKLYHKDTGELLGYKTVEGDYVQLPSPVEVVR